MMFYAHQHKEAVQEWIQEVESNSIKDNVTRGKHDEFASQMANKIFWKDLDDEGTEMTLCEILLKRSQYELVRVRPNDSNFLTHWVWINHST